MILSFLLSFILGILIASFSRGLADQFFPLLSGFLIFLIVFSLSLPKEKIKKFLPVILCCFFGFILGIWRLNLSYPQINENHLFFYQEQKIVWQGVVVKEPEERLDKINLTVKASEIIKPFQRKIEGQALVAVPFHCDYQYGDLLLIKGKLKKPLKFEGFDYPNYLAARDIYALSSYPQIEVLERNRGNPFLSKILEIKGKIKNSIQKNFTEPQGSLVSAIFLGQRGLIPERVREIFSLTGISHLLAISGLHLVILIAIFSYIFINVFLISRRKIFYLLLPLIFLYLIFVGMRASAVRAGLMSSVLIFGESFGKKRNQVHLLVLAAFLMLIFNPKLLAFDIGFELSFLSVLGIYFLNPEFEKIFSKIPNRNFLPLRSYFNVSLAAYLFTLPLILYYFGNLSISAPLVNLLVLPFLPFLMFFIFLFAFVSLVFPFFSFVFSWPVWLLLTYVFIVARFFASLPYLSFSFGSFPFFLVVLLYFLIVCLVLKLKNFKFYFRA